VALLEHGRRRGRVLGQGLLAVLRPAEHGRQLRLGREEVLCVMGVVMKGWSK
jgi:hypothetical protein